MLDTIYYEDYKIDILINTKLKHSYISIDKNKNILIKTPYRDEIFIRKLVIEKSHWINKQLKKLENIQVLNEKILYSKEFIQERVYEFSSLMKLSYTKLKFRKMKSRWGSCTSKGVITLNTRLCQVNEELINYVIVHELAHLRHMNHSKDFHTLVEMYLPASKEIRAKLKQIRLA